MVEASNGYDLPSFEKFTTFRTWPRRGRPRDALSLPQSTQPSCPVDRRGAAPHKIGEQIYVQALQTQMAVRHFRGEAMEKTLDWAAGELEGFTRN